MEEQIYSSFADYGINISRESASALFEYYNLLKRENAKYNLTSVTGFEEVLLKHFIDSAAIVRFFPEIEESSVIDVGTGGGFPGLVIAIICPKARVTLLESVSKKTEFLRMVVSSLNLKNVEVCTGRAEEFGSDENYRECYDIAVSRAVARLNLLLEYVFPFTRVGGRIVCYKGSNITEETLEAKKALTELGGDDFEIKDFLLPENAGERVFVSALKIKETPKAYPRRTGVPAKRPIK